MRQLQGDDRQPEVDPRVIAQRARKDAQLPQVQRAKAAGRLLGPVKIEQAVGRMHADDGMGLKRRDVRRQPLRLGRRQRRSARKAARVGAGAALPVIHGARVPVGRGKVAVEVDAAQVHAP